MEVKTPTKKRSAPVGDAREILSNMNPNDVFFTCMLTLNAASPSSAEQILPEMLRTAVSFSKRVRIGKRMLRRGIKQPAKFVTQEFRDNIAPAKMCALNVDTEITYVSNMCRQAQIQSYGTSFASANYGQSLVEFGARYLSYMQNGNDAIPVATYLCFGRDQYTVTLKSVQVKPTSLTVVVQFPKGHSEYTRAGTKFTLAIMSVQQLCRDAMWNFIHLDFFFEPNPIHLMRNCVPKEWFERTIDVLWLQVASYCF